MTYVHCVALPCRPADHVDVALLQLVSDQRMNGWVEGGLLHEQCRTEAVKWGRQPDSHSVKLP